MNVGLCPEVLVIHHLDFPGWLLVPQSLDDFWSQKLLQKVSLSSLEVANKYRHMTWSHSIPQKTVHPKFLTLV